MIKIKRVLFVEISLPDDCWEESMSPEDVIASEMAKTEVEICEDIFAGEFEVHIVSEVTHVRDNVRDGLEVSEVHVPE